MSQWAWDANRSFEEQQHERNMATIKARIPGCIRVDKTPKKDDVSGSDYKAILSGGAHFLVDGKDRRKGCSRYWKNGSPEVALETWSVVAGGKYATPDECKKIGWTLSEKTMVDFVLFSFHPTDYSGPPFLWSFQLLRSAFVLNYDKWVGNYRLRNDETPPRNGKRGWESEFVPVPAWVVHQAICDVMNGLVKAIA